MFWFWILGLVGLVIGASVFVGLNLKSSRKHRLSREEMLALKSSGAFKYRKSSQ